MVVRLIHKSYSLRPLQCLVDFLRCPCASTMYQLSVTVAFDRVPWGGGSVHNTFVCCLFAARYVLCLLDGPEGSKADRRWRMSSASPTIEDDLAKTETQCTVFWAFYCYMVPNLFELRPIIEFEIKLARTVLTSF